MERTEDSSVGLILSFYLDPGSRIKCRSPGFHSWLQAPCPLSSHSSS